MESEKPCDACENCLAVNEGSFLDLIEIDAASNTSVDDVRDLREKINFSPNRGKYKVYIIDEVHMLSTAAFNALLKTLEEPPSHAIFILATTEIHKIPATVLSRCQRHEFRKLSVPVISGLLEKKALEEGFEIDPPVFTLIARQATGSMRDGISLLDQLASTNQKITLELAEGVLGTAASQQVINLAGWIIQKDLSQGLQQIQSALDTGADARQFARQMVDYLRNLLLIKLGDSKLVDTTRDQIEQMLKQATQIEQSALIDAVTEFSQAASDSRSSTWQPGLALEMALVKCVTRSEPQPDLKPVGAHPVVIKPAATPIKMEPKPVNQGSAIPQEKPAVPATASKPPATEVPVKPELPPASPDLAAIQQDWTKIKDALRGLNKGTHALVNSARVSGMKNGCLMLAFASDILKGKMESNDHLEITRRAVQQVTGMNLPIRCEVAASKAGSDFSEGMSTNSLINSVVNELGGRIVEEKK